MSDNEIKMKLDRSKRIYEFCEQLHRDIDQLYELMVEAPIEEEQGHINYMIEKLQQLNK